MSRPFGAGALGFPLTGIRNASITNNATNVNIQINGLNNLTSAQQQLILSSIITSVLGGSTGVQSSPLSSLGLGYPYGYNLGNFLGTNGPAAVAASAYFNPLGLANGNPISTGSLGGSLYPGYSNFLATGSANLPTYGSSLGALIRSPGLASSSSLAAYLPSAGYDLAGRK